MYNFSVWLLDELTVRLSGCFLLREQTGGQVEFAGQKALGVTSRRADLESCLTQTK